MQVMLSRGGQKPSPAHHVHQDILQALALVIAPCVILDHFLLISVRNVHFVIQEALFQHMALVHVICAIQAILLLVLELRIVFHVLLVNIS